MKAIDIVREQLAAYDAGRDCATVTIVSAAGSAPRSSGRMLVYANGETSGTIGGGAVELLATQDALNCIKAGAGTLRTYDLDSPDTGMTCGGSVSIAIEVFRAAPLMVMCGAGHVGGAMLRLASFAGFSTLLLDDRDEAAIADKIALADRFVQVSDYEAEIKALDIPSGAYIVIATHGHAFDGEALLGALSKQAAYIGMIGSSNKVKAVFEKLRARGVAEAALESVFAPIGLDLGGETPEEIAVSVMAEMLMTKYGRAAQHLRDRGK